MNIGFSRRWPTASAALGVVLACTVAACGGGGGGGGGGGPTQPPAPTRSITWTAAGAPGSDTIFLDIRDLSNPDSFVLQIRVKGASDLYGFALDLVYPSSMMTFASGSVEEGPFLTGGGSFDTRLEVAEPTAGRIIMGYSRLGDERGRNGNGLLLTLTFNTTANGSSDITIESEIGVDRDGFPMPMTWLGGTVQVQR